MSETPPGPGQRPEDERASDEDGTPGDTGGTPQGSPEPQPPPRPPLTPGEGSTPLQPQPEQAPIRTGVTLGRYQVQEYLGQGAYGPNYRAYDPNLSRSATIEVLEALRDQDVRGRLAAAAPSLVELHHPNLVDVYEVGERQGVPYLVSAYVEGVSLRDAMRGGISQEGSVRLLQGVAKAVDHAHWQGIVHGDLRPATIMLGPEGRPLVRDGGLVPLLDPGFRGAAFGIRTGALHYEAPEQLERGEVSSATDRYAFATIAYELLTGTTPFPGHTTSEILSAKERGEAAPASSRAPHIGPATDQVLATGLARNPDARWQSCSQMMQALAQALNDDAYAAQAAYGAAYPVDEPAGGARRAAGRQDRWPWILAAIVGAALIALGALLLWLNNQPSAPSVEVSSSSVLPGDAVIVTGSHLPAQQSGTVEFASAAVELSRFQADQSGNVTRRVTIPGDASPGAHLIMLCWNGSCQVTRQLNVLTPSPSPTPTPSPSPTPTPTRTPTPTPSPSPSPSPSHSPSPSPSI
jgi:serine/threonine protein kinase